MPPPPPPPVRVYETTLYAEDLAAAVGFYRDVLGLSLADDLQPTGVAFRLPSGSMLLIFDPRVSAAPGRPAPSHGARGPGHIAFAVGSGDLPGWRDHLADHEIHIEQVGMAGTGGGAERQLYVRDPAGNSVELVVGELWP